MHRCEIAIVGAGPAGAAAAAVLAAAGVDVTVLDRKTNGDEKPCAGGILTRAIRHLPHDLTVTWQGEDIDELILTRDSDYLHRHTPGPLFRTVLRRDFDGALVNYALQRGARVLTGVNVKQVEQDDCGITLITDSDPVRAQAVIGADGTPSTVGHRCGMVRKLDLEPSILIKAVPRDLEPFRCKAYIDFNSPVGGYTWMFPKEDHLSVGSGGLRAGREAMITSTRMFMGRFIGSNYQIITQRFACVPLPSSDICRASDRVILAGDAAGLVDPFTREGISWAVQSGKLAAKAVLNFLGGKCKLQAYEGLLEQRLLPELRAAGEIAAWTYEDPVRAHRWLRERWYFWHGFCGLLTGRVSHRTLLAGLRVITRVAP